MDSIIYSISIGAVQGIAEFLPISSSAHLVIFPYIFNWQYAGLQFDVALHFGTMLAIVIFFWSDWLKIVSNAFRKKGAIGEYPKNMLWQILVATIPAGIVGFLIKDHVEAYFHSPVLLSINLIVFGFLLWIVDKKSKSNQDVSKISYLKSFLVGLAQSLALIPGVSRSGITIIASRGIGLERESAAKFAFLLGTPAMIGAFLLEFKDVNFSTLLFPFWLGVIVSAVAGFFAIKFLLNYLKKSDFSIFLWYRILIAIIVLSLFFVR
jgi:undecaprenyl-diphosphatase